MTFENPILALENIFSKILPDCKIYTDNGKEYEDFIATHTNRNDVYISYQAAQPVEYNADYTYDIIRENYIIYIRTKTITDSVRDVFYSLNLKQFKQFSIDNNGTIINCRVKNTGGVYVKSYEYSYFALSIEVLY